MTYPEGIDVSLWQGDIASALNGQRLAIVKISQSDFLDPKREQHWARAQAADLDFRGVYHWLDPEPTAYEQAALLLRNTPKDADFLNVDVEGRILKVGGDYRYARSMARAFISYLHAHDPRPVLQYSSRGTWPGDNGQDGNWVADYTGDPMRLLLRLTRRSVPWVIWQYTSGGGKLDRNRFDPAALAKLCKRAVTPSAPQPVPAPAAGGPKVKFIQISATDAAKLGRMDLPPGTRIESFDGEYVSTIGPTNVAVVPGLVDAHTNRRAVVVSTGRYFEDHVARLVVQVAVLP